MGPTDSATENSEIARLRELFPGWEIHRVFGGYEAVPEGTPVIRATYLDTLEEKLADQPGPEPR